MLLTSIANHEHRRLWANPGWLPEEIGIIVDNGQFFCFEGEDLKLHLQRGIHNIMVYSLTGITANIESGQQQSHIVAFANGKFGPFVSTVTELHLPEIIVAHSVPEPPGKSQWHLFNDFHVRPVSSEEALSFNTSWKTPAVVTYQLKSANNQIDFGWRRHLDTRLLYLDLQ
jgi:PAB-dependent poly(A)-specific ribonuclease subunit 2